MTDPIRKREDWPRDFEPEKESVQEYRDYLLLSAPYLDSAARDTLRACRKVTFDGDLPSKSGRDYLCKLELIDKWQGFQVANRSGMALLDALGQLDEMDRMILTRRKP